MDSSASMKISPMDVISAIMDGKVDPSDVSAEAAGGVVSMLLQNRNYVMVMTTSIAVLIGCVGVLLWRRSHGTRTKAIGPPKPLMVEAPEVEVGDGKKKVTVFFGTQTGTAEGFAKVGLLNYVRQ